MTMGRAADYHERGRRLGWVAHQLQSRAYAFIIDNDRSAVR